MYAVLSQKNPEWDRLFDSRWEAEDYIQELYLDDAIIEEVSNPLLVKYHREACMSTGEKQLRAWDRFCTCFYC